MTTVRSNQTKAKSRPRKKPIATYFVVRKLICPATKKEIGALVPATDADRHQLREKNFKVGQRIRAEVSHPRNERFNRLVHGMGVLITENIDGFIGKRAHDAIKQLQQEAKIYCETESYVLHDMEFVRYIPRSLSYDSMDEDEFKDFWHQCCNYLIEKYWPNLDEESLTDMIEFQKFS